MTRGAFFLKPVVKTEMVSIGPGELPLEPFDEVTSSFWVCEFQITNTTPDVVNVSITDRQEPPICLVTSQNSIGSGQTISAQFMLGRRMIDGIRWWASRPGVHGFIIGHEEYI